MITAALDQMAADVIDTMGELVTFSPIGADAEPVQAIISSTLVSQPSGMGSETWDQQMTFEFLLSDMPSTPKIGDVVIYGDTEYAIAAVIANDGRFIKCIVMVIE
jgi:hypothetical protein